MTKADLREVEVGVDGRGIGCDGGPAGVEATIFTTLPPDSYSQVYESYPVIIIEPQGLCSIKSSVKFYFEV